MPDTQQEVAMLLLKDTPTSLPATRQGAVAIRKLELQLTPYPAFFRELKDQTLQEVRESNPAAADQIEAAMDAADYAIEIHLAGLRAVAKILNNH